MVQGVLTAGMEVERKREGLRRGCPFETQHTRMHAHKDDVHHKEEGEEESKKKRCSPTEARETEELGGVGRWPEGDVGKLQQGEERESEEIGENMRR